MPNLFRCGALMNLSQQSVTQYDFPPITRLITGSNGTIVRCGNPMGFRV